jgi:hypothetical protein
MSDTCPRHSRISGRSVRHFRYMSNSSDPCLRHSPMEGTSVRHLGYMSDVFSYLSDVSDTCVGHSLMSGTSVWHVRYLSHMSDTPVTNQIPVPDSSPVSDCCTQTGVWDCCRHLPQTADTFLRQLTIWQYSYVGLQTFILYIHPLHSFFITQFQIPFKLSNSEYPFISFNLQSETLDRCLTYRTYIWSVWQMSLTCLSCLGQVSNISDIYLKCLTDVHDISQLSWTGV